MHRLFLIAPTALVAFAIPASVRAEGPTVCYCGSAGTHSHTGGSDEPAPFRLDTRWTSTFTNGSGLVQGDPTTITWSIVPDGNDLPEAYPSRGETNTPSSLVAALDSQFGVAPGAGSNYTTRPWFTLFQSSFNRWSQISGLSYTYVSDDGAAMASFPAGSATRGDVRIGGHNIDGGSNILAYNYFPNTGDMVIDTSDASFFGQSANNYRAGRNIIMHEHGHGIGLNHLVSNNSNHLMEPFLSTSFDGPQFDDILGAQRGYGDALEKGAGNNTVANATPLGSIAHGATVSRGTHADDTVVTSTQTDFISIDDNSDIDVFGFSVAPLSEVTLTLTPKGPTYSEGPEGGTETTFNTAALSNLNLELLASNGSVLATAAATGAGFAEIIAGFDLLAGGTYFARITGLADNVQMYRLDVSAAAVPEPSVIALAGFAFAGLALRRRRA